MSTYDHNLTLTAEDRWPRERPWRSEQASHHLAERVRAACDRERPHGPAAPPHIVDEWARLDYAHRLAEHAEREHAVIAAREREQWARWERERREAEQDAADSAAFLAECERWEDEVEALWSGKCVEEGAAA